MRTFLPHAALVLLGLSLAAATDLRGQGRETSRAANEQVAEIIRTYPGRGVMADDSQPTVAEQAVRAFAMREGFQIDLMAAEPDITQPLFVSWDSRGRAWVVQYRQYQFPAGLKIVSYDQHLRAVFDKVPEPPPHGTPGADVITVFEDVNGDGQWDRHDDVLAGLNIATAVQVGHGGIWVLNPPYLLFYPDVDGDDVPDSDPQVRLSGFGLEDTHSVANSLMWGPDGWLYGANGSTTTGIVSSRVTKGVGFQGQCIWRYHPDTDVFEIFAEGGGNTFSLEIDALGRVFSGTNGGNTRGFHYPQGAYFQKNWGKHGPLTNPFAFGFLTQMRSVGDERRFPQAFTIYEGGLFPQAFDTMVVAPNAMVNLVWLSRREADGSTFQTVDVPNLAETDDRWFRPVHAAVGPDGGVYIADWYDTRLSHVSPVDDWHKGSGRVYRIRPIDAALHQPPGDLRQMPVQDLVALLQHPNKWWRKRAALEIGWRHDLSVEHDLIRAVDNGLLDALWALHNLRRVKSDEATRWLGHEHPAIRRWVIRLLGDRHVDVPREELAHWAAQDATPLGLLSQMARQEPDLEVVSQLAATAKRIPAEYAIPIIEQLMRRDALAGDPHLPLMVWWALESHADAWPLIESLWSDPGIWDHVMVRQTILERIMQRYALTDGGISRCERFIELAPDDNARERLLIGWNKAFQGRNMPPRPPQLDRALRDYRRSRGEQGLVLAVRQREEQQYAEALAALRDDSVDLGLRMELAAAFGETHFPDAVDTLLGLALRRSTSEVALQRVALRSLSRYDDPRIAAELTRGFDQNISAEHGLRDTACRTLVTRPSGAVALLTEILEWRLKPRDVPADVVQQLRAQSDTKVQGLVEKAFGPVMVLDSPDQAREIARLQVLLDQDRDASRPLDARPSSVPQRDGTAGKLLFEKHCAACHQLFGEGRRVGPPLDRYDRGNVTFWLQALVAPSAEIREGYQSYALQTVDGRIVTGMMAEQSPQTVTIRTAEDQLVVIPRDETVDLRALPVSLMPADLLKPLTDEQIRDLFAYLMLGAKR